VLSFSKQPEHNAFRLLNGRWGNSGAHRHQPITANYGKRSLAEVAMFRYKKVIGRGLHARTLPTRKTEAKVACKVINNMTGLGMPVSRRVA
jgi:hypothetical protein